MRTASPDHIEELALIAMSRLQRSVLERWAMVLAGADQHEQAEQVAELARAAFTPPELERTAAA